MSSRTLDSPGEASGAAHMNKRVLLRLAGALLVGGFLLEAVVEVFHPSKEDPNKHAAVFAEYARSGAFTTIHLVQFIAILIGMAGFLVLYRALVSRGDVPVLARLAAAASIATGSAFAVLQAIDGVALKHAVDAWAKASGAEQAIRFADAETVRWLEWGANSYFRVLLGLTLLLFGLAIARTAIVPRWLGWSGVVSGLLFGVVGVIVGEVGFDHAQGPFSLAALLFFLVFAVGTLVVGWRTKERPAASTADAP
jgi:hypothetical protein